MDERADKLEGHLRSLWRSEYGDNKLLVMAKAILADPQAHIDALVEAGVLQTVPGHSLRMLYRVVPPKPHRHKWRAVTHAGGHSNNYWSCNDCPAVIPISMPPEEDA